MGAAPRRPLPYQVPVATPTSTAAPGGVRLCCWWQGSSPGAGAAAAARTQRRQRSCQPDSPPRGTGLFRADRSGPPHGGAGSQQSSAPRSSLQPHVPSASLSNLSLHSSPWQHRRLRTFAPRCVPSALSLQYPLLLLLTIEMHNLPLSHPYLSIIYHLLSPTSCSLAVFIPLLHLRAMYPMRTGLCPSLPALARAGPQHTFVEQHFQGTRPSPPAPGAGRLPLPSAPLCPPAAPAGSRSPGCRSDGVDC